MNDGQKLQKHAHVNDKHNILRTMLTCLNFSIYYGTCSYFNHSILLNRYRDLMHDDDFEFFRRLLNLMAITCFCQNIR